MRLLKSLGDEDKSAKSDGDEAWLMIILGEEEEVS
jgi:hypothetical protein